MLAHERMADAWAGRSDFGNVPNDLARTIREYGDQGRGDVSDLLTRLHSRDADSAAYLQTALLKVGDEKIPFAVGTNNSMAVDEPKPEPQPVPESPDPEEPDPEEPDPEEPDPEQCTALMQEIDAVAQTLEEAKSVGNECQARVTELQTQLDAMKQERFEKWMTVGGKAAGAAAKGAISGFPDPRRMIIGGVGGRGEVLRRVF